MSITSEQLDTTLFPISLNSERFSTEHVRPILKSISNQYLRIVIIIADQLQVYNSMIMNLGAENPGTVIRNFAEKDHRFEERTRWIWRIARDLNICEQKWTIIGINDIADQSCFKIFRNVMLLFAADASFRDCVTSAARSHVYSMRGVDYDDRRVNLSALYILEEIALSIRLHVGENIPHEHYLGRLAEPVKRLYLGEFSTSVFALAGVAEVPDAQFNFFELG